jgi:hypothetical protein
LATKCSMITSTTIGPGGSGSGLCNCTDQLTGKIDP